MSDRFMLNLGSALMEQVGTVALRNGVTKGEVARHAVRLYLAVEEATSQGGKLQVVLSDGTVKSVLPLILAGSNVSSTDP